VRSISTAQQAVLDAGVQAEFVRVSVKDSGGTFRDLTTYPGFNAVRSVQWGERVDDPHQTFDVELMRELYQLSLSPFVAGSAVNKGFSSSGSGQLVAVGREVKIEVAVVAMDTQPASGDWVEVLRGRIDTVDPASGANVRIGGRGLSGRLAQQYIKQERVYSFASVAGGPVADAVAGWTFDASSSHDDTGNGHNGTDTGVTYGTPAKFGAAAQFTGSAHKRIDFSAITLGSTWSFACWVRALDTGSITQPIFNDGSNQGLRWKGDRFGFFVPAGTNFDFPGSGGLSTATWYSVVVTCSGAGGDVNFYINGALDRTAIGWGHAWTPQIMGTDLTTDFNGALDAPYVWSRELTAADALAYHNLGATAAPTAVALRVWEPQMVVTTSPLIYCLPASRGNGSTPDPGYNRFFKCSQAGTTGTTEPTWSTGSGIPDGSAKWDYVGAPTTAGNPVEQIIQNILDDNKGTGDPTVTLYTPSSPGWAITQFLQSRTFTLDAVRALALQIGWDLRYKWKAASSSFEFTLYQPTRSSPSVDFTFQASDFGAPTQMLVDIANIRNAWRIIFSDASDLWPDGTPRRKVIEVNDSASITKYGELWAEIQEDSASQIDSSSEATTLVNAALSDCKEPTANMAVPLKRGFPWVELNDFYKFKADGVRFDSDQSLAVTEYQQSFESGRPALRTTLAVRGLPTIGAAPWLGNIVHPHIPPRHIPARTVHFDGAEGASLSNGSLVGGTQHQIKQSTDKVNLPKEYEIHVYDTPGSALDSTTLATVTSDLANANVKSQVPGKPKYQRVVQRWRDHGRPVRSQPGVETAFTPFQANAGHLSSIPDLSRLPLNGGFETNTDASGPPDHWSVSAGTWASNVSLVAGSGGISGESYVTFSDVAVSRSLDSDVFVVEQGALYELSFWIQEHNASINGQLVLTWLDNTKASISTVTLASDSNAVAAWQQYFSAAFAPSNARFAKLSLQTVSGANAHGFDVDLVKFRKLVQVGALMFGANAFPAAGGTTFMNPGGPVAANQAAALNIELPTRTGSRFWLHGFFIRSATAPVNMSYAITDPNGPLLLTWTGGITSETTTLREVRPLPLNTGNRLDIQVVATVTGGGPSGGTNIIATYGVWN
jgi:hypothetical protein